MIRSILPGLACALVFAVVAHADDADAILVTATKAPEPALTYPAVTTLIDGAALRARGAYDLRGALAEAAGVEVVPGGDAGPAGSVVALQGLTEFDAYLLVIDGVPYGGAFYPQTPTLDLTNIDRIEVLRGSAPVSYGATSFVGVVQALHYRPGEQPTDALLQGGTRASFHAAFASNLPSLGDIAQSIVSSAETRDTAQQRGGFDREHLLYRAAADMGIGRVRFDLDLTRLGQSPYSPHPREGTGLTSRFPLDANVNPTDARGDQDRAQSILGLTSQLGQVEWQTTASVVQTWSRNTRGYLRPDFAADGVTHNADGFRQRVWTTDAYFDTHLAGKSAAFDWVGGADLLYGTGHQRSLNFEYGVLPAGSNAPDSYGIHIDESTIVRDERVFAGGYANGVLRPLEGLELQGGLRINHTYEGRCAGRIDGGGDAPADTCGSLTRTRLSGSGGASYALLQSGDNGLVGFADYRDTFKPAAIDFGPEAEGMLLRPETAHGWEAGGRAAISHGRFTAQVSYFDTRFRNLVIAANVKGLPALASAGAERFEGVELEGRAALSRDLSVSASYAHHLARFTDYAQVTPDGGTEQLGGNRLVLSPKDLASLVAAYTPPSGPQASATVRYVGPRYLDKENTVPAGDYATVDGRIGWRARDWGLFVDVDNLTDARDPVVASELGDQQFYRLTGRRVLLTFERRL